MDPVLFYRSCRLIPLILLLYATACATLAPDVVEDAGETDVAEDAAGTGTAATNPQQAIASQVPNTDIFLFAIDVNNAALVTEFLGNITDRSGYDNQPRFIPGRNDLLFSSINDGVQSDVYVYRDATRIISRVTNSAVSEYSPTPLTDETFSAVVVEDDGTQRLWRYNPDGTRREAIRGDITGVGYHAFIGAKRLALFIVAEPIRLDIVSVTGRDVNTVATNIGRSLHAMPGGDALSFVQHYGDQPGELSAWHIKTGERVSLVRMPAEVEDMVWLRDGRALAIDNGALLTWQKGQDGWRVAQDLARYLQGTSTRLAVNDNQTRLAIVTELESP